MSASLDQLLRSHASLWRGGDRHGGQEALSTGFATLDDALPAHGWGIGQLNELLPSRRGIGELSLLLPVLQQSTAAGRWAAFVRPPHIPYAPALGNAGIHLDRLLIVESSGLVDTLWAAEQIARSGAFALMVVWLGHGRAAETTPRQLRRLQLAAEAGKTCAIAYRPVRCRDTSSPAALRIVLGMDAGRLQLDIIKSRGGRERHVTIDPTAFDRPQGVDWPAAPVAVDHRRRLRPLSPLSSARESASLVAGIEPDVATRIAIDTASGITTDTPSEVSSGAESTTEPGAASRIASDAARELAPDIETSSTSRSIEPGEIDDTHTSTAMPSNVRELKRAATAVRNS